jgi:hypothetical protein
MPFKEAAFWVGITIFGTGLFGVMEGGDRMPYAIALMIIGVLGTMYSVVSHYKPQMPKFPVWVILLLVTWVALGYDIYDRSQSTGNYDTPKVQWGCKPSANTGPRFETNCFATTDKPVPHGLSTNLHCNHELLSGAPDDGSQYGRETDYGLDPRDSMRLYFHFRTRDPAFDPSHPIVLRLVSNTPLDCVIPPTTNLF